MWLRRTVQQADIREVIGEGASARRLTAAGGINGEGTSRASGDAFATGRISKEVPVGRAGADATL